MIDFALVRALNSVAARRRREESDTLGRELGWDPAWVEGDMCRGARAALGSRLCPSMAGEISDGVARHSAFWIRVSLAHATFGALVCSTCGVVACAPIGRRLLGRTAASARAWISVLSRDAWQTLARVPCPKGESGAGLPSVTPPSLPATIEAAGALTLADHS